MKYNATSDVLPCVFDLEPGREVVLYIPLHLTREEADRICRLIQTFVVPKTLLEGI